MNKVTEQHNLNIKNYTGHMYQLFTFHPFFKVCKKYVKQGNEITFPFIKTITKRVNLIYIYSFCFSNIESMS